VDNREELDVILRQKNSWAIHQFNKDENGHDKDSKELFPQIPTVLVIDFFASNSIDDFTLNKDSHVILKATGIDAVQWSYILIPPYSNS
jgi:hypothetical protein